MENITLTDDILGKIIVHGIGKLVLESTNDFNIPHLHFITYFSEQEKAYLTLSLELGIHFSDNDYQLSIQGMLRACLQYLNAEITKKKDVDKLVAMVSSTDFEIFWALYRQFEFELAKFKKDLSSEFIKEIKRKAIVEFATKTFLPNQLEYRKIPA